MKKSEMLKKVLPLLSERGVHQYICKCITDVSSLYHCKKDGDNLKLQIARSLFPQGTVTTWLSANGVPDVYDFSPRVHYEYRKRWTKHLIKHYQQLGD